MILGIEAAAGAAAGSGSSGMPTASGEFDFVNGSYVWQASTLTAGDVVDETGWIGASGLSIAADGSAAALLYSSLTTFIAACNFTAVFEIETITDWLRADILHAQDDTGLYYINLRTYPLDQTRAYDSDNSITRSCIDDVNGLSVGIHKIAVTVTADHQALSIDGQAVITDSRATALPVGGNGFERFYLGGGPTNGTSMSFAAINIRSMAFYDSQPDSNLPVLSA